MAKMQSLQKVEAGPGAKIVEADVPTPKAGEILVKIKATSICGTDRHIYKWDGWAGSRIHPPMIFGHEFAGEVIELGAGVDSVKIGDLVSGETHIFCGTCYLCRTGNAHICEKVKLRGIDVTGCFAEYLTMPANTAWVNPKGIEPEVASVQEPLGNAVHTVFEGGDVAGRTVALFGPGPIGLCATAICRNTGADMVIMVGTNPFRLDLAKKMGATHIINSKEQDPVKEILDLTNGLGVDVFLELSGAPIVYKQGFESMRLGGRASLIGIAPGMVSMDMTNWAVFKQARIYGVNGRRIWDTWYRAASFMRTGVVDLKKIITHRFPMSKYEEAFAALDSGQSAKIVMTPGQ